MAVAFPLGVVRMMGLDAPSAPITISLNPSLIFEISDCVSSSVCESRMAGF